MAGKPRNEEVRRKIIEGIQAGMSAKEISEYADMDVAVLHQYLARMTNEGVLERVERGEYRIPVRNGNGGPVHNVKRVIEVPAFMKQRDAVTVFVERSPQEIEGVIRFEVKANGQWFPLPTNSDIRVCVGDDIPRWSPHQETYHGVSAFRVTRRNGEQAEYPHDERIPVTVDFKR